MNYRIITYILLEWYRNNARRLPWRESKDPYCIWISEVMLQQTRVETVSPYYERWMQVFPDVDSLAAASEDEVLKLWEGLGYYNRARNIVKTARKLRDDCESKLPETAAELRKLPGVGPYIAGAISSIAFSKCEPALDGNGLRVLARLMNFHLPVNQIKNKKIIKDELIKLLPEKDPGDLNQGVMDFGSLICVPAKPLCNFCPLKECCFAYRYGKQNQLPINFKKKKIPHYAVVAGVLMQNGKVLIDKRVSDGLLGGMWEFPGGKVEKSETLQEALARELKEELGITATVMDKFGEYKHAYTHFKVTVHAFVASIESGKPTALEAEEIRWVRFGELDQFPMGKIDRSISHDLQLSHGYLH